MTLEINKPSTERRAIGTLRIATIDADANKELCYRRFVISSRRSDQRVILSRHEINELFRVVNDPNELYKFIKIGMENE